MKNLLMITLLFFCAVVNAQELTYNDNKKGVGDNLDYNSNKSFVFNSDYLAYRLNDELKTLNINDIRRHELGEEVAKRIYLLEKTYTYKSAAAPGSFSGKTIIAKPVIYNSVHKLEKAISKQVKKGIIGADKGSAELTKYLNIALKLYYEDTSDFENALKNADSYEDIAGVFKSVEFR